MGTCKLSVVLSFDFDPIGQAERHWFSCNNIFDFPVIATEVGGRRIEARRLGTTEEDEAFKGGEDNKQPSLTGGVWCWRRDGPARPGPDF